MMPTAIHRQVEAARRGELSRVIARMPSGWAVLGDPQITRGYCLLLPDPVVPDLNALSGDERRQFLEDMAAPWRCGASRSPAPSGSTTKSSAT